MTHLETIPDTWEAGRDEAFFRIVARLFPCTFLEGASSLLAANDAEPADERSAALVPVPVRAVRA
jgi:hypothetical protein